MIIWVVDVIGFLLLCAGSKLATPRILRLLCRLSVFYVLTFTVCYYFWLIPRFRHFQDHPHLLQSGISTAFRFQGFWPLLGNMVLMQTMFPIAVIFIFYFAIKWLATKPGFDSRR